MAAKRVYGWPEDAQVSSPGRRLRTFPGAARQPWQAELSHAWNERLQALRARVSRSGRQLEQIQKRQLPEGWEQALPSFPADAKGVASRDSSGKVLNALAKRIPWLIGGAADLAPSTKTDLKFAGAGELRGRQLWRAQLPFRRTRACDGGDRQRHGAVTVRPYGSGFLIFTDYMRDPIRLAALMRIAGLCVFTHDSIGVGEDGPTHQPIEQLASLRGMPGLLVIRPADANEVVEAWRAVAQGQPSPDLHDPEPAGTADAGPREVCARPPGWSEAPMCWPTRLAASHEVILIATGSEVSLCLDAHTEAGRRWHLGARGQHAFAGSCSRTRTRRIGTRFCRRAVMARVVGRAGLGPGLGALRREQAARSSACEPSAPPRR